MPAASHAGPMAPKSSRTSRGLKLGRVLAAISLGYRSEECHFLSFCKTDRRGCRYMRFSYEKERDGFGQLSVDRMRDKGMHTIERGLALRVNVPV